MDRRERSDLFERLVIYRRVYHLRSRYDAEPTLAVSAVAALVEQLMQAAQATAGSAHPA